MQIRITGDMFTGCERALMVLRRDQMPFAIARALTDTARDCQRQVTAELPQIFDRPTPFTMRALAITPARKEAPRAEVFVKDIQAKYLRAEETGGTRSPAQNTRKPAQSLVLPGKAMPLDQFGNMPPGVMARLRREAAAKGGRLGGRFKGGKFGQVGSAGGSVAFIPASSPGNKARIGGYFRRLPGDRLTRLTVFEAATHYTKRFGFRGRVERVATATFAGHLSIRFREAVASAR